EGHGDSVGEVLGGPGDRVAVLPPGLGGGDALGGAELLAEDLGGSAGAVEVVGQLVEHHQAGQVSWLHVQRRRRGGVGGPGAHVRFGDDPGRRRQQAGGVGGDAGDELAPQLLDLGGVGVGQADDLDVRRPAHDRYV